MSDNRPHAPLRALELPAFGVVAGSAHLLIGGAPLRHFDLEKGKTEALHHEGFLLDADQERLLLVDKQARTLLWRRDMDPGKDSPVVLNNRGHAPCVGLLCSNHVLVGDRSKRIRSFDLEGATRWTLRRSGGCVDHPLVLHPKGQHLAVCDREAVLILDLSKGKVVDRIGLEGAPHHAFAVDKLWRSWLLTTYGGRHLHRSGHQDGRRVFEALELPSAEFSAVHVDDQQRHWALTTKGALVAQQGPYAFTRVATLPMRGRAALALRILETSAMAHALVVWGDRSLTLQPFKMPRAPK